MKKRSVYTPILVAGMLLLFGTFAQAKSFMAGYYEDHPMTVEDLTADLGKPLNTIEMGTGIQKMIFGPKDSALGYTYYVIKDGMVVDKNHTSSLGKRKAAKYLGPTPASIMTQYYSTHPMSVEELTSRLGTPVSTRAYDNGIQKMVFGPKDNALGYTYYLIKNGMVVDKNHTGATY